MRRLYRGGVLVGRGGGRKGWAGCAGGNDGLKERVMSEATFDDLLPLSARRTAPGEYDIVDKDGRRLWFMEGAALAEWVCLTLNSRPTLKALEEWGAAYRRYQSELENDDSGQLACGTGMLLSQLTLNLLAAADSLAPTAGATEVQADGVSPEA